LNPIEFIWKSIKRIISTLERIKIRPQAHVTKLVGDPGYRLRVGDCRVMLDVDEGNLVILVIKIGQGKRYTNNRKIGEIKLP